MKLTDLKCQLKYDYSDSDNALSLLDVSRLSILMATPAAIINQINAIDHAVLIALSHVF